MATLVRSLALTSLFVLLFACSSDDDLPVAGESFRDFTEYSDEQTRQLLDACRVINDEEVAAGRRSQDCDGIVSFLVTNFQAYGCDLDEAMAFLEIRITRPGDAIAEFERMECVLDG